MERVKVSLTSLSVAGEAAFSTRLNGHGSNGGRGICGPRRRSRTLRQLALEGKSASSIAAALGAPSRNAVIGKANRIGVKLTGNIHCVAPRAGRPSKDRPRRPTIARTNSPLWKRAAVPAIPRERKPAWAFAEAQVGEMLKVGLDEIREDSCPWPLGDPTSEDFVYCGVQTAKGRSYCAGHCRMAYKPPNARVWDGQRYVAIESMAA